MRGRLGAVSLIVVCASVCPAAQTLEWWNAEDVRRELHLTQEQVRSIDVIFRTDLDQRRKLKAALDRAEREMTRAIEAADEPSALEAIDTVVELKRQQNRARHVMLLRIAQVLTPAQRKALGGRSGASRGRAADGSR